MIHGLLRVTARAARALRFALVGGIMASPLVIATSAQAADDYPSTNATTGYIAPGGSLTGSLETTVDVDRIRTSLVEGGVYRFEARGSASGGGTARGPSLVLFGAGGEVVGKTTYDAPSYEPKITYTATHTGNFYLDVASGPGLGTYTVSVTTLTPPPPPAQSLPGPAPTPAPAPAATPQVDFFQMPSGSYNAAFIINGPDGAMWFNDLTAGRLGRITTAGDITEVAMSSPGFGFAGLTAGPDGAFWYAHGTSKSIVRVTTGGASTSYRSINGLLATPIAFDLEGRAWFNTGFYEVGKQVGRITTAGQFTYVPVPSTDVPTPDAFATGWGGKIWYTNSSGVARIGADGIIAHYPFPASTLLLDVRKVAYGHDGSLWFTDSLGTTIGWVAPDGITKFVTLTAPARLTYITSITPGSDGAMWFAFGPNIGRITPDGVVNQYPLPDGARASSIVGGPDGNLWFTDASNDRIGRVTLTQEIRLAIPVPSPATTGGGQPPTQSALRLGATFSSAQTASQSYLRFYNTGTAAGTAKITLSNFSTGASLGQWTSPSIPAGAEMQFGIGTIENDLNVGATKPAYYSLSIDSGVSGYFQHVLFRPSDGTLTNLSTCGGGVTADAKSLSGVHTSLLQAGFPSTVVINNTGTVAAAASLGIFDARNGNRLGTYNTSAIPAGGQLMLPANTFELVAGAPTAGMYHYVVKAEGTFSGFLQHLVNNLQAGVTTDMTTACSLSGTAAAAAVSPLRLGSTYSSVQTTSQSYLRFFNSGAAAGTAKITLSNSTTGASLGQWTSASIPAGAEVQFGIGTIESDLEVTGAKPQYYALSIQSGVAGYLQHVLFRPSDGTLTNLSTCGAGITTDAKSLSGVHTSLLQAGFPSTVVVNNTGTAAAAVTLGIFDARNGARLGTYNTSSIPAGGQLMLLANAFELVAGAPTAGMYHYVVKAEGTFTGFLQHLVNNIQAGVTTDMTTACALAATL